MSQPQSVTHFMQNGGRKIKSEGVIVETGHKVEAVKGVVQPMKAWYAEAI